MPKNRRLVEIVILSDIHLGTYGCHATELLAYLKSIHPELLILNGDIIDGWAFSKNYFPNAHMAVLSELFKMMKKGTRIVYITGNHDEFLRKYTDMEVGNLLLTDKYLFQIGGKSHWVFHGDIFDYTTKGSAKIIAKIGGWGYDWLILAGRAVNWGLKLFGRPKVSLSKKIKNSVKKAVKFISDFEEKAIELAIDHRYDCVICGHIHQPTDKTVSTAKGSVRYLNTGDWIENLSWLEYHNGEWKLKFYEDDHYEKPAIETKNIRANTEAMVLPKELTALNFVKP
ncbi:UDP-2,3-diacylglucosamine diphosphatase [Bergeyella sp. RCAD1439]|uniref:UDP-2,3-diacylglucosamine diphosphatase n=1 Tax=Bergeyella anatis TaxID=3113737 RepID=UPI002E19E2A6|nr:UDP-2,3-diacylglucosamine diphosphatase [Bergeyella sp. RCAD1439]